MLDGENKLYSLRKPFIVCTLNVKFQFIYWHTNHDSHSTNQFSFAIILYHTILGTEKKTL
jgi:hypothetical protein